MKWLLAFEATVLVLSLMIYCGIIPEWGRWYSASLPHRMQTEALLKGRLALSNTPSSLEQGFAWAEGGVQQVSGLGIPIWRLPFEAFVRLLGQPGFPDRLALGTAFFLVAFQVFKVWLLPLVHQREKPEANSDAPQDTNEASQMHFAKSTTENYFLWPSLIGFVALLLMFPPLVRLLETPLAVLDEVLAYVYFYGISLMALLVVLVRCPSWSRYWGLCFFSGIGGLVRPTLFFYGSVTVALATIWIAFCSRVSSNANSLSEVSSSSPASCRIVFRLTCLRLCFGPALFAILGLSLFLTNQVRFGDGFEFGHKLNVLTSPATVYATRFDHPFEDESFGPAARELFGALFLVNHLKGSDPYHSELFAGQSQNVRWRDFYFLTFDWSCALFVLAGWIVGLWPAFRMVLIHFAKADKSKSTGILTESVMMGLWSLASTTLLWAFYLRVPCISSRYMMDFAPAFAVAIGIFWLKVSAVIKQSGFAGRALSWTLLAALLCWVGVEISQARCSRGGPQSATWEEILAKLKSPVSKLNLPTSTYLAGFDFERTGIPFNGTGWSPGTNTVASAVILFIDDPQFLELEVFVTEAETSTSLPFIRAKVGLESLIQESCTRRPHGCVLRFSRPTRARYQRGIQPLFLAIGPKEKLADRSTPYHLLRVSWKQDPKYPK